VVTTFRETVAGDTVTVIPELGAAAGGLPPWQEIIPPKAASKTRIENRFNAPLSKPDFSQGPPRTKGRDSFPPQRARCRAISVPRYVVGDCLPEKIAGKTPEGAASDRMESIFQICAFH
jgi:hypothetical protein